MGHRNKYCTWILGGIMLVILATTGCYYDKEDELYPRDAGNCDTLATITYTNKIEAITTNNCAISGCHTGVNPTGGINLNTYEQVKSIADNGDLSTRVVVEESMPPSGPLNNCDIEAIQEWINNGAPL